MLGPRGAHLGGDLLARHAEALARDLVLDRTHCIEERLATSGRLWLDGGRQFARRLSERCSTGENAWSRRVAGDISVRPRAPGDDYTGAVRLGHGEIIPQDPSSGRVGRAILSRVH